jgi:3-hydroxyacyl-CoA dehydrogenase/enoyl-CoA hydratase/3-hydroxybutyryl-CoA epimerase
MNDVTRGGSWKAERDGEGIAWLILDRPGSSTNVLSSEVLKELAALLDELERSPPAGLIVISAKASGFIAGADIKEFTSLTSAEGAYQLIHAGQQVIGRIEALPCPSVAAIHGFALGGGFELALACRYRVAVNDERLSLGLPEVQLGIHPGFGGTVRSVHLAGVRPAMQMMLTGRPVRADKALRLGLVDRLVPADELKDAARDLVRTRPPPRQAPLGERLLGLAPLRPLVRRALIAQVASRARREHYPAPYAIIDLWTRCGARGAQAYEEEARSIAQLFTTATSRNLVRAFLLQDRLKSPGSRGAADIQHVHVVGAGVMGGDIAAWSALRGFTVTLEDRTEELVQPALLRAQQLFARRLHDTARAAEARARLRADVAGEGVAAADVVIEAIFESLEAKRDLYSRLEPRMKPAALLATNTSSLLLEPLGERLARPGRLVGLHFFNPVAQMPLIEIVKGARTDQATLSAAVAFARRLDKLPVPCTSAPGFIVNRVLMPYLHEAMYAAQEGVPLPAIDAAAVSFGMPVGPIELADVIGLDVALDVSEIIARELRRPSPDLAVLREFRAAGKLGKKSGQGFYPWRDGKAVKGALEAQAPPDLTDRLILALANECVACLREGVAEDADLIDAAVIFGTGFAPFRGGPLAYARSRGIREVMARLTELAALHGARFQPDPAWQGLLAPSPDPSAAARAG